MPRELTLELTDRHGSQRVRLAPTTIEAPITVGGRACDGVRLAGSAYVLESSIAEFFCDEDDWCVRDTATEHGTFVDGNRIFMTPIRLEVGQIIRIGTGEHAPLFKVLDGAADPQEGVDVAKAVGSFALLHHRTWKKHRRRLLRVALPSLGGILVVGTMAAAAVTVVYRRLHPAPIVPGEGTNAAQQRLVAIMSGEARPEDVDVGQIIKDASFGRTSMIADTIAGALGVPKAAAPTAPIAAAAADSPLRPASSVGAAEAGFAEADRYDTETLAVAIESLRVASPKDRSAHQQAVDRQSRWITEQRLREIFDRRQAARRAFEAAGANEVDARVRALAAIDDRLDQFGIDTAALRSRPAGEDARFEEVVTEPILEAMRLKLLKAMDAHLD